MVGKVGSEVCLQRVGGRRSVARVGKWRNFGGAGAESRTVGGAIWCGKALHIDTNSGWEENRSRLWRQKRDPG